MVHDSNLSIISTGRLDFNEEEIRREVKKHKALGDETRLKMMRVLEAGEKCVCELIDLFQISQPMASHHLKILENAGLLEARREGKYVYYRLRAPNDRNDSHGP